jgi:hypothetical protein
MHPRMKNWTGTGKAAAGSTNWGRKARKKRAVLGFRTSTRMLWRKARVAGGGSSEDEGAVRSAGARRRPTPSQTR